MKEVAFVNELFLPFGLESYRWSAYCVCNVTLAVLCSISLAVATGHNTRRLARPAFMVVTLTHLIFQWPLALFSPIFERSLADFWFFAASIHAPVVAGILWVVITPRLTASIATSEDPRKLRIQNISTGSQAILLALFAGLTTLYLSRVGWRCTGLYAMLFDPELALLARETSGKLLGIGLASYGYGVLANVVCPLVMYTSLLRVTAALTERQFAKAVTWITIAIFTLLVVLLPGAKGNLLPTAIVLGIGIVATRGTWMSRIVVTACVFGTGFLLLTATEVLRERQVFSGGCYDFGTCVSRHDACSEASTLLQSLRHRDLSLGLFGSTINDLESDLHAACSRKQQSYESSRCISRQMVKSRDASPTGRYSMPTGTGKVTDRMGQYAIGIAYRLGRVPVQVASWYHLYVAEHGSPGIYALPLSSILFGRRVIMPIRVHDAYYHIYSTGDRTSTGTAPTSFLLAYPADLGFAGILLAMTALLFFDLLACVVLHRLPSSLRLAGIGLIAVGCMNLILSDFGTTMLSHGTAAALLLLFSLSFVEKRKVKKTYLMLSP
ncbi:MAG: hypothetical protein KBI32_02800 [Phycisphaerae bacterium]|nr:hypothetical protein [Syntrophobacterales bacterium]MBP8910419.1 hypothetical protein [Phycisphaerae bacterium]